MALIVVVLQVLEVRVIDDLMKPNAVCDLMVDPTRVVVPRYVVVVVQY